MRQSVRMHSPAPAKHAEIGIADAHRRTGIPARTLQGAARRGDIPSRRVGRNYLLDREGVDLYARFHKSRGRNARTAGASA